MSVSICLDPMSGRGILATITDWGRSKKCTGISTSIMFPVLILTAFFPLPPAPSPILTCLMSWQPTAFLIVCACQQNRRTAWGILINIHLFASNHPPTYFAVAFTNWSKCPTTVPLYLIWWAIIERYDRQSAYTCARKEPRVHIYTQTHMHTLV